MDFGMPFLLENRSIEESAALCAELGLKFVELNMSFPLCTLDRMSAPMLRELEEKYGIYFTFHLDEALTPCAFDSRVRAAYVQNAADAIRLAAEAGMPTVNLHWEKGIVVTQPDRKVYLYDAYREDYLRCTAQFRAACEEASGGKVNVCVENTDGYHPFRLEAIELLLQSPVFHLTLDVGHNDLAHGVDMPFYDKHFDELKHMHLHDSAADCHLALGDGHLDIAALIARGEKTRARAVIEVKTVEALRRSVERLPQYIK